jgi:hypothetical protein
MRTRRIDPIRRWLQQPLDLSTPESSAPLHPNQRPVTRRAAWDEHHQSIEPRDSIASGAD